MEELTMNPMVLTAWAFVSLCFFGLLIYRSRLTRYEDDQLFLSEDPNKAEQEQQTDIVRRVNGLQPLLRGVGGVAGLFTVTIVSMYVWDAWKRIP